MILIAVPLLGDSFQTTMFVNSILGCYLIGSPVTFYCLRQADRLREANQELVLLRAELEITNSNLAEKIRIDQMTGLLSREYFLDDLQARHIHSNAGSLLIIDADNFKAINDQYGHLCGDEALVAIADAIKSAVRTNDIVGRIGGEEFAVFLPGALPKTVTEVAERIRDSVEKVKFMPTRQAQSHPLTVSIGGVEIKGLKDMAQIMGNADRNLYKAKGSGRNKVVFAA